MAKRKIGREIVTRMESFVGELKSTQAQGKESEASVSEIQRYDPDDCGVMHEHQDGDWMRYSDHVAALNALRREVAKEIREGAARGYQPHHWRTLADSYDVKETT